MEKTSREELENIAESHNLRLSEEWESGHLVFGLHGFLSDIQQAVEYIDGYYVESATTGYYLYEWD